MNTLDYLIDMRHMPDDSYNYIAYYMDRWPKFHVMWSLMRKSAVEVGVGLAQNQFTSHVKHAW